MTEATACPHCAGTAHDRLLDAADPLAPAAPRFTVVRCRDCALAYTNPRPTPNDIAGFYPDNYTPHQERAAPRRHPFIPLLGAPAGRLLDFGCGAGALLGRLHQLGWEVTGLDCAPRMVQHVRERLGLPALCGSLPHSDLAPASFAAITMAEALEHVHDPLGVLRAAHGLLIPGGQLLVSVPNLDSLAFRWFGADWFGLDVPRHLTHFTPPTLCRMLERAGFRVERLQALRHNSWLRHSARRAGTAWGRLLGYRAAASLVGWYSAARQQSNGMLAVAVKASAQAKTSRTTLPCTFVSRRRMPLW